MASLPPAQVSRETEEVIPSAVDSFDAPAGAYFAELPLDSGNGYRVALEDLLGFHKVGARVHIDPRVPATWTGYQIAYRYGGSVYRIRVEVVTAAENQPAAPSDEFVLTDDGTTHEVVVRVPHPRHARPGA